VPFTNPHLRLFAACLLVPMTEVEARKPALCRSILAAEGLRAEAMGIDGRA
jgi:hypothetical protein